MTLTEITEKQELNKAAVSRRIKKLIQSDLVEWDKANHADQRLKYIKLTDKGQQFNSECKSIVSNIVSDMLSDLSEEQIEQARYVLGLLIID